MRASRPIQGPTMTWPDLVLSMEQSGMIFDSCTIQLLILSRRRRSTVGQSGGQGERREISPSDITAVPNPSTPPLPSLC